VYIYIYIYAQSDNGGFTLNSGERVSNGLGSCGSGNWSANVKKLH